MKEGGEKNMSLMFIVAKEMLCCGPGATGGVFYPEMETEVRTLQLLWPAHKDTHR